MPIAISAAGFATIIVGVGTIIGIGASNVELDFNGVKVVKIRLYDDIADDIAVATTTAAATGNNPGASAQLTKAQQKAAEDQR